MLGGELSYTHFLGEAVSLYVTLARGFKAGGFNLGLVPDGQRAFGQETLWNAEAGLKALLADGALSINTSIFYSIRRDQQVESSFQINPNDPASFVFFTDNAAEGEATGVEAEIRWMPLDSLELYANLGYLGARFMTFDDPLLDLAGRDQAHAPRYTIAAGGEYRHASGLFLRVDVSGKDAFYFDVSHDQRSDDYAIASLRLGYEAERWSAQLSANNVFDETYAVRGFYFGNEPPDFPPTLYTRHGDPRQLGVIFEMRFDE
jgi:outer membrane receptor protein involved in Fe transport